jgi:hypothetical protein
MKQALGQKNLIPRGICWENWGFCAMLVVNGVHGINNSFLGLLLTSTSSLHVNALIKPQNPIRSQYSINAL